MRNKLILRAVDFFLALLFLFIAVKYVIPMGQEKTSVSTQNETMSPPDITWDKDNTGTVSRIHSSGTTLETRVLVPDGYFRDPADADSLTAFLRNYPMKEHGSPALLYDGTAAEDQSGIAAVFALPLEAEDFQQCADSVMRVFAEYYWKIGQQERISFHFTTGFSAEYSQWRDGCRLQVSGNEFTWKRQTEYDDSYEAFVQYLRIVFVYANTQSMDMYEAKPITLDELAVGDVWLEGGSPGHVMMVVDLCRDENGKKAFLLAQGHMPAQEFVLMENPLHPEDPWYYEEEISYPFVTDVHEFQEGSLQRLSYFP